MKETDLSPIYVFLSPPSLDILEQRLRDRGTESEEAIAKVKVTDNFKTFRQPNSNFKVKLTTAVLYLNNLNPAM